MMREHSGCIVDAQDRSALLGLGSTSVLRAHAYSMIKLGQQSLPWQSGESKLCSDSWDARWVPRLPAGHTITTYRLPGALLCARLAVGGTPSFCSIFVRQSDLAGLRVNDDMVSQTIRYSRCSTHTCSTGFPDLHLLCPHPMRQDT